MQDDPEKDKAERDQLELDLERLRADASNAEVFWLVSVMDNILEIVRTGRWPDGGKGETIN